MRSILTAAAALALVTAGGACSKDVCQEGYEKRQDCAESMNCARMDPSLKSACDQKKQLYSIDYDAYKVACRMPDNSPCECTGTEEAKWQQVVNCTLKPEALCECQ